MTGRCRRRQGGDGKKCVTIGATAMKSLGLAEAIGWLVRALLLVLAMIAAGEPDTWAEAVAPSQHWGAIAYPDQQRTLLAGVTLNRFTEFKQDGQRFSAVHESDGFNFASISWTERPASLPGWAFNLTGGIGPTYPEPTQWLQNRLVHHLLSNNPVPVGRSREETDFMINGSVTRWLAILGQADAGFTGGGVASGSLYHEAFARAGVRRLSIAQMLEPVTGPSAVLQRFSRFVRFSAMGQYGRLYGGSAYGDAVLAEQSFLGQASVSIGIYGDSPQAPDWELEFAATIDSGLFVTNAGHTIERRFGSIAFRFPYGVLETWNDWLGGTDSGPTYGVQLMVDVRKLYEAAAAP
jgi:hypothetical protein